MRFRMRTDSSSIASATSGSTAFASLPEINVDAAAKRTGSLTSSRKRATTSRVSSLPGPSRAERSCTFGSTFRV